MTPQLDLGSRILLGSVAGLAATAVMSGVMGRFHRRLPPDERYPLPLGEITEIVLGARSDETIKNHDRGAFCLL